MSEQRRGRGNSLEHFELNILKIYLLAAPCISAHVSRNCDWIRLQSENDDGDDDNNNRIYAQMSSKM
jgi:hypothetical protein